MLRREEVHPPETMCKPEVCLVLRASLCTRPLQHSLTSQPGVHEGLWLSASHEFVVFVCAHVVCTSVLRAQVIFCSKHHGPPEGYVPKSRREEKGGDPPYKKKKNKGRKRREWWAQRHPEHTREPTGASCSGDHPANPRKPPTPDRHFWDEFYEEPSTEGKGKGKGGPEFPPRPPADANDDFDWDAYYETMMTPIIVETPGL